MTERYPEREMCPECGLKHFDHEKPDDCISPDCPYKRVDVGMLSDEDLKLINYMRLFDG